jgi:hypothetical protein
MKHTTVITVFVLLALSAASAQTFDLGWNTIDGGGLPVDRSRQTKETKP